MHTHILVPTGSRRRALDARRRTRHAHLPAAMVAHELMQPLAALTSNLEAAAHHLQADAVPLETIRELFADLAADVARADAIVRHVLALVRHERTPWSVVRVQDWLICCAERLGRHAARLGVGIAVRCEGDLEVHGDVVQLDRVIDNVVGNALHAIADARDRGQVVIEARARSGEVLIAITDDGPGFPAAVLADPDALMTTRRDGSGLGLAVASMAARAHGGRLELGNAAGGAVVTVHLPCGRRTRHQ